MTRRMTSISLDDMSHIDSKGLEEFDKVHHIYFGQEFMEKITHICRDVT